MKQTVSVIPGDGIIIVDGVPAEAKFGIDPNIRAIQWYARAGHIEYGNGQRQLPLTQEMYSDYVEPFVNIWRECQLGTETLSLDEAKSAKLAEIIAGADNALSAFTAQYAQCEEDSWPRQETGARVLLGCETYVRDSQAAALIVNEQLRDRAVEFVKTLAAERNLSPMTLAEKIVAKAEAWHIYQNRIFTEERVLKKTLAELVAMGDAEKVMALQVVYTR